MTNAVSAQTQTLPAVDLTGSIEKDLDQPEQPPSSDSQRLITEHGLPQALSDKTQSTHKTSDFSAPGSLDTSKQPVELKNMSDMDAYQELAQKRHVEQMKVQASLAEMANVSAIHGAQLKQQSDDLNAVLEYSKAASKKSREAAEEFSR